MVTEARSRIVDFLETQLFQPVLQANPDDYPEFRRAEIAEIRRTAAAARDRVRAVPRAGEAVDTFRDAARAAAAGLDDRLAAFGLPTFAGVRDELDKLAQELGVAA